MLSVAPFLVCLAILNVVISVVFFGLIKFINGVGNEISTTKTVSLELYWNISYIFITVA